MVYTQKLGKAAAANLRAAHYTATAIRRRVERQAHIELPHHACAICHHWVKFQFGFGRVFFNPNCACGIEFSELRECGYQDIADWLAMQNSDEARDGILDRLR